MAAPSRRINPDLDPDLNAGTLNEELEQEPFRFNFFQMVRLLKQAMPSRSGVGEFVNPASEVVRFRANASVVFPASAVQAFKAGDSSTPAQATVNFMGLTGPLGVLPASYTELLMERVRAKDTAGREFLDIFNHRMISLFYRAWEKYFFPREYEGAERDVVSRHLLDLIGLGTAALQNRQDVPDDGLLFYSGILAQHPRSASGLRQLLEEYFSVPVEVQQFAGRWYRLDSSACTRLGESQTFSQCLGQGTIVGDEIWDQHGGIRVRLGPLSYDRYLEFLPGEPAHTALRSLVRFYGNDEFDFEAELILKKEETPACRLGAAEAAPRLGWTTWAVTQTPGANPNETVLSL
jgi:type VI secretion system protein ImpH